jgi:hypothetical protein
MKLTKSELKEMIREVIREEKQLNEDIGFVPDPDIQRNYMDYAADAREDKGGMNMFYNSFSSPEARKIVDGKLADYVKGLRKLEGKVIADWMKAAKSGTIDFFDLMRGFKTGDVRRANGYEIDFLSGLLSRDKIQDRFRAYFKGKKGKPRPKKKGLGF